MLLLSAIIIALHHPTSDAGFLYASPVQGKQATAAKHCKAQFVPPNMRQVCVPSPDGVQRSHRS